MEVAEHIHHLPRHRGLAAASSQFLPAVGPKTKPHWNRSADMRTLKEPRFLPAGFRLKFDPDPAAPSTNDASPSDRKGSRAGIPEPGYITRNGPKAGSGSVPSNAPPPFPRWWGNVHLEFRMASLRVGEPFSLVCWFPAYVGCPPSGERPLRHSPLRSDIPSSTIFPIGAVLWWTTRQHGGVDDRPWETMRLSP